MWRLDCKLLKSPNQAPGRLLCALEGNYPILYKHLVWSIRNRFGYKRYIDLYVRHWTRKSAVINNGKNFQCWSRSLTTTVFDSVWILFVHFFIYFFVLYFKVGLVLQWFFNNAKIQAPRQRISKIVTCKWIKESRWKIREAINEVGACSLGLSAGILWRPLKYFIWFKCDMKKTGTLFKK